MVMSGEVRSRTNSSLSATSPLLPICRKSSDILPAIAALSLRTMALSQASDCRVRSATVSSSPAAALGLLAAQICNPAPNNAADRMRMRRKELRVRMTGLRLIKCLALHLHQLVHRQHMRIEVRHDNDGTEDHQSHHENTEGEGKNGIGRIW